MRYLFLSLFFITILSCGKDDDKSYNNGPTNPINPTDPPNILLIIADDMGKDATSGFTEGTIKPTTPNIDKIKNEGLSFNNFWVNPTCSPTRASIITGKYAYRTGVKWAGDELDQTEKILQKYINEETDNTYSTALIGKWHLSGNDSNVNPETLGIDYFAGLIRGSVQNYYQWQLSENGAGSIQTEYTTKAFSDLSINWINEQTKPWFLWLAYNAPHTPFHVPPSDMHSQGDLPDYVDGLEPQPYYMAAIEAMDFQIGKILESIPDDEMENTIIIFLGDNGTPGEVAQSPFSNFTVKGSLYQGGVNVPLFVSGKGVDRVGEDNSLILSTDLFSTIGELAGSSTTEIHDSKSFKSLLSTESTHRAFQYSEMESETRNLWAISNGEFKLIVNANGNQEMYDLVSDLYEGDDLLNGGLTNEEENAKAELEVELANIRN